MKHDWEYKKLGEVALIKGRIGFRGYTKNDLVEKGKGAITLSPANIIDYKVSYEKCQYISWFKYEESPEIMIFNGDIIFAKTASIGKVALVNGLPDKATINPQFVVLKELKCNNKYLYYTLRSDTFKQSISLITNGVAIPTVSQSNMGNIPIPVPPIPIQQQIVAELDKVSEIIEKKKQQVKELDTLAQSIFYDMFGDPVENEKGWEIREMKDCCSKIGSGATPKGGDSSYKKEGISLIRSLNVHNQGFKWENLAFIDDDQAEKLSNVELHYSDVLLNITGASVARCCVVPDEALPARVNQHVSILRCNNALILPLFMKMQLTNTSYQEKLISLSKANGATREALPKNVIERLGLILPPLPLQQSFAQKVEAIERQKELITASIKEAQLLFDARMDYWFGE